VVIFKSGKVIIIDLIIEGKKKYALYNNDIYIDQYKYKGDAIREAKTMFFDQFNNRRSI